MGLGSGQLEIFVVVFRPLNNTKKSIKQTKQIHNLYKQYVLFEGEEALAGMWVVTPYL